VKGTTLTRFKEPLGEDGWRDFVDLYRIRLVAELGDWSPYFYPFKRILMWARRN
jgi:trans-aconitate 2-methyltransferase